MANKIIARTDGSRPSFLIKNGVPDIAGALHPEWNGYVNPCSAALQQAIGCTGRINYSKNHVGTGFLIAGNLIITNRHVLQQVAKQRDGKWLFYNNVGIDFGFEYEARTTYQPRAFKKVVFAGPQINGTNIDHTKADIALIALEGETDTTLQQPMAYNLSTSLLPGTKIFALGYPNIPKGGETPESAAVFNSTYGVKRIAPGEIIAGSDPQYPGRLCHDASTLGGNSGSLIVACGQEGIAAALHYGGIYADINENWSHSLAHFCGTGANPCLKEHFDAYGVKYT